MNSTHPSNLRLYLEEEPKTEVAPTLPPSKLEQLCQAFSEQSGWSLKSFAKGTPPHLAAWTETIPGPYHDTTTVLGLFQDGEESKEEQATIKLAQHVSDLLRQLHTTRSALWQREAQLASAVPLVVRHGEEDRQLAERLEAVLRSAAVAVNCQSAALYVLDDDTSYLKLRSHFGLSDECFVDPPRRLRGSKGDLEALTGHAVVLEKPDRCEFWNVPHPAAVAICVPVSTANVPLGTMWVFGTQTQAFSDAEVNLVEVVAGRIAVELEREILLREHALVRKDPHLLEAVSWQQSQWESAFPQLESTELAAAPGRSDQLHGDHVSCHLHEDGRLRLILGSAEGEGVVAGVTAGAFAAAGQAAATLVNPTRRLGRINENLSRLSAGDQSVVACCATYDPETGKTQLATAGSCDVFVVRPHGWEQLTPDDYSTPVGVDMDQEFKGLRTQLDVDDVLLVVSGSQRETSTRSSIPRVGPAYLAEALLHHHHLSAEQMVEYLQALLTREATIWRDRPALMVVRRQADQ